MARRPKTAKLVDNDRLRDYVQDRLAGAVRSPGGMAAAGPITADWKGRNKPRRQDRRWSTAWSPEQIANRLPAPHEPAAADEVTLHRLAMGRPVI